MLDVLITISDDTPPAWVNQCRRSVTEAAALAGYPVSVIEVPGVPGHIGQAMANGFARSAAPYVTWVDDDDWLLPNAFASLALHLTARPTALFARELQQFDNGQIVPFRRRHHLSAYRRDIVERVNLATDAGTPNLELLEAGRDGIDVIAWVYVRRMRISPAMRLRDELRRGSA